MMEGLEQPGLTPLFFDNSRDISSKWELAFNYCSIEIRKMRWTDLTYPFVHVHSLDVRIFYVKSFYLPFIFILFLFHNP